ncbi:hypothetical protein QCM8_282 [Bacillus phage QCM8]|nr:hypothetical protein QCM8_6 [Bacillus phage QCM8]AOZ62200.1 hypothetical protein QCM8_282 [Bacillus phage QCM8]
MTIVNETPTFSQFLAHMQTKTDIEVIGGGKSYFTIEDAEGYRAYFQVNVYGYHYENPNYYQGFSFSTCHKPNRSTGTGWQHKELQYNATIEQLEDAFYDTLEQSRRNILSGKEKMDTTEKKWYS